MKSIIKVVVVVVSVLLSFVLFLLCVCVHCLLPCYASQSAIIMTDNLLWCRVFNNKVSDVLLAFTDTLTQTNSDCAVCACFIKNVCATIIRHTPLFHTHSYIQIDLRTFINKQQQQTAIVCLNVFSILVLWPINMYAQALSHTNTHSVTCS